MLANGHVICLSELDDKESNQYLDRRISNMLSFKPDLSRIPETDVESNKSGDIERIIAQEVAEIVNRKSRLKKEKDDISADNEETDNVFTNKNTVVNVTTHPLDTENLHLRCEEDKLSNEESQLNSECQQKSTQTDPYKSPAHTFRRKSIQIMNKIFIKEDGSELSIEDREMDDQNSEGDCKASPLDMFKYPNIRRKFFLLTFDWIALGVVYNSLSYNTPNLGVNDYLAFFIGK